MVLMFLSALYVDLLSAGYRDINLKVKQVDKLSRGFVF